MTAVAPPITPVDVVRDVIPIVAERAGTVDRDAEFPVASLAALRATPLMGLLVPREHGGMGGSLADMSEVARELAGACTATAVVWAMHCQQVAAVVRHAGPALRERVLPAIARGEVYVGSVTTERGKGGHLLTAQAPLEPAPGGRLRVHRDAPISTGALHADAYLITMRAGPDAADTDVRLVWADRSAVELQTHSGWDPMGMRGTQSVAVTIDAEVAAGDVVGPDFRDVALRTFVPAGHIAWASSWLGAAQGAFRRVVAMLRDPRGRRGYDLDSELLVTRLARCRAGLDCVEALLERTIATVERIGRDGTAAEVESPAYQILVNELKVVASEQTFAAVDRLVDVVGLRHGYIKTSATGIERVLRDLRSASLMYANDRLDLADGRLALFDRAARLP
ncbi:butyryl-CoA dehydrogenase [Paractinoplanes deccanensis]|uniref:Butyryl-CoA dehydrogenase n=1 Tax=Paractinoplanes deccanensis TaxID=113561 RepID=A0ABQ3YK88_9ACTN|nr:acyl-CoA dehydrogenase family protein [Actinoplanes deccanensis]GID80205.1 butyryl-CoA dehydrogenase [Actinoplanes deccanensis]